MIQNFKLQWFIATKTLGYTHDYMKVFYQIYLNHTKVIHYRNGYPVFSLSTPALYSKPMANLVARGFYRSVQNKNLPNLMSFAVNDSCNANCSHCSFYNGVADKKRKVVNTKQAIKIIKDAQELGVSVIDFVGGEPLLRQDLPEIIASVDKDYSTTTLFTNGWFLNDQVIELKKSGLDGIYVSLDSADAKSHDKIRKKDGLYKKAVSGISAAKQKGFSVGISTIMTRKAFYDGKLKSMIELAKNIGVHELLVFDAVPTGRLAGDKELLEDQGWIEEMIESVAPYNKSDKYPGILIYAYTTSHRAVGCNGGTSYCYISPYGDMMPCDFNHKGFGNVLDEPFYKVWERLSSAKHFCTARWGGCIMKSISARKNGYARPKAITEERSP